MIKHDKSQETFSQVCRQVGSGNAAALPCLPSQEFSVGSFRAEAMLCSNIIVCPCVNS
jgi:hypothetical protein